IWQPAREPDAPTEDMLRDIPRPSVDAREVSSAYSYRQEVPEEVEAPTQNNRDANETREIIAGAIFLLVIIAIIVGIILFILWRLGIIFQPAHSSYGTLPLTSVVQATLHLFPLRHIRAAFVLKERLL